MIGKESDNAQDEDKNSIAWLHLEYDSLDSVMDVVKKNPDYNLVDMMSTANEDGKKGYVTVRDPKGETYVVNWVDKTRPEKG
jgi:hypothetical protein